MRIIPPKFRHGLGAVAAAVIVAMSALTANAQSQPQPSQSIDSLVVERNGIMSDSIVVERSGVVADTLMNIPDVAPRDTTTRFRVGLVLSGGGAKGIAHIGVIKALEDNDIAIDCVAGTSMGAVVGSLYACGYSPAEMMELIKSPVFQNCATGTIAPAFTYYFSESDLSPAWGNVNISFRDSVSNNIAGQIIPSSLINPIPMNMEFLRLFTPYSSQCGMDFDRLMVPFRCVTSDVYHKHKIVLRRGLLGRAVRASMSFPLVFRPIEMDGVLVYDGGIYDNFPVDVMESDFDPDFIIGVSVSGPDGKPERGNIMSQLEDMIIQNNDYSVPSSKGIKIQCPVLNFGVLDFDQADTIYEIGYKTGLAMVDSIKSRTPARRSLEDVERRRSDFASATPEILFNEVKVSAGTPSQRSYLRFLFDRGLKGKPFDMQQTQDAYFRAVSGGKLSNLMLVPELGKVDSDSVKMRKDNVLLLQPYIKNPWNIGVGGWITTDTQSMLYLDFGYHTLSYNSLDVDLSGWIGQSYMAGVLSGKFTIHSRLPASLKIEAVGSRQKFYTSQLKFYQINSPTFISEDRRFIDVQYCLATGRKSIALARIGYGDRHDKYYPSADVDYSTARRDNSSTRHAIFDMKWEYNTLDNRLYPLSGRELRTTAGIEWSILTLTPGDDGAPTTKFRRTWRPSVEILWREYWKLHKNFHIGAYLNVLATGGGLRGSYTSALVTAPAFTPTPSTA
ncbi:MAG: patatin-like phospholipase family protein, partial [Muribaculaceae bacterium]|nr:patatin-like phospholipase family protein [Muribaculaceae bacterium]